MSNRVGVRTERLIVVCRADATRRYDWLPAHRPGDLTIALDWMAHADLAGRDALLFDALQDWEERNAEEHRIAELMVALGEHPKLAAIELAGHRLIDFAELRMRPEVTLLLRGWTLARAGAGARALICDPAAAPALLMGLRAGLGMDPESVPYTIPPALPGSRLKRSAARPLMRALAAGTRSGSVRVVAVAAGKLSLALASLSHAELRSMGVGAMPFPGLDHGNSALLALRRGLPLLPGYGPSRVGRGPAVRLPERLELDGEAALDRALTLLVSRLLAGAAPELAHSIRALDGLTRVRSLRALLLPSAAYGASRVLIEWAHERGVRVGAMQHGIYVFRDYDGGDRRADLLFGWGEGTAGQINGWADPRPTVLPAGVPGTLVAPPRPPVAPLRRALIATSSILDTPLAPVALCETFVEILAPGLRRLGAAGVELELRPHPNEDPGRYRRLLDALGLDVGVTAGGPFRATAQSADILISSASSVAFEAAALGLPVLLWIGGAPEWVRRQHLVEPWIESLPGTFQGPGDFGSLIDALLERPVEGFGVARELSRSLARYAQPFDRDAFAEGLRLLGE
ncbi:MAG: hypothetical protein ACHQDY_02090 [Solirubrobacterales bacterium]